MGGVNAGTVGREGQVAGAASAGEAFFFLARCSIENSNVAADAIGDKEVLAGPIFDDTGGL